MVKVNGYKDRVGSGFFGSGRVTDRAAEMLTHPDDVVLTWIRANVAITCKAIHDQTYALCGPYGNRCIPFRYRDSDVSGNSNSEKIVEVLMINSTSGPGLLFTKGGWENDEAVQEAAVREAIEEAGVQGELMDFLGYYPFKSKTHQDEFYPEGSCKAAMFALLVKEELESWPEQSTRNRTWLIVPEALDRCWHPWMRDALENGFSKWPAGKDI
nr:nudix hydrolase 16, mitochondrial-like [Quercus suber]